MQTEKPPSCFQNTLFQNRTKTNKTDNGAWTLSVSSCPESHNSKTSVTLSPLAIEEGGHLDRKKAYQKSCRWQAHSHSRLLTVITIHVFHQHLSTAVQKLTESNLNMNEDWMDFSLWFDRLLTSLVRPLFRFRCSTVVRFWQLLKRG